VPDDRGIDFWARNRKAILSFTDMATEKEKQLVRLIIQSALDRAEKAQRLSRRLIQAAIGRALRAEFGSERPEVAGSYP
jgi:hypothetical protein